MRGAGILRKVQRTQSQGSHFNPILFQLWIKEEPQRTGNGRVSEREREATEYDGNCVQRRESPEVNSRNANLKHTLATTFAQL